MRNKGFYKAPALLVLAHFFAIGLMAQTWNLSGNGNATATSVLGTTNAIPLNLTTGNAIRLRIAADGKVGIGTANPQQRFHVEGPGLLNLFVSTSGLSSTSGSGMIGYVKALPTANGQRLGYFLLGSRGGAENQFHAAGMVGYAQGAWTAGSSYPAYLAFETTPAGSAARSERLRITASGNVGIGTTAPSASALLDLSSTSRGLLTPRMTETQRNAVSSPAQGLLIFQTDGAAGFYYFDGGWKQLQTGAVGFARTAGDADNADIEELRAENEQLRNELAALRQLAADLKSERSATTNASAYLGQNAPNPSRGTTTIRYGLPEGAASARLVLLDANGKALRNINLNGKGSGQLNLDIASLPAGLYTYTLWVDGKQAGSKQLVIAR